MTALTWDNRIFTNVYNAVSDICPNVVNSSNNDITKFPTTDVSLLTGEDENVDLENCDGGANLTYEVEIYTNGTNRIIENLEIGTRVYNVFKKMGFRLVLVRTVRNEADNSIFRRVARYRRFIGDGETIELIYR